MTKSNSTFSQSSTISSEARYSSIMRIVVVGLLLTGTSITQVPSCDAFQSPTTYRPPSSSSSSILSSSSTLPSPPSTIKRSMTFGDVSEFYQTYPLQSAILTCGVKASVADCIAQVKAWGDDPKVVELRRNAAYIIYGGIFVGMMSHLEYNHLFPFLFGTEQSLQVIIEKVLFDDFVSAPLMWLPPAYLVKASVYNYSWGEGLRRYIDDIQKEGLLTKYWSIWVPAQSLTFSVIPDHFRVAFMASVSFFWFILFSSVASKTSDDVVVTPEEGSQL